MQPPRGPTFVSVPVDDWDRFRESRLAALRESLGSFTPAPRDATIRTTGTIAGDG